MALLSIRDLALGYDGRVIVEHLNFSVQAGEYLCVVGKTDQGNPR